MILRPIIIAARGWNSIEANYSKLKIYVLLDSRGGEKTANNLYIEIGNRRAREEIIQDTFKKWAEVILVRLIHLSENEARFQKREMKKGLIKRLKSSVLSLFSTLFPMRVEQIGIKKLKNPDLHNRSRNLWCFDLKRQITEIVPDEHFFRHIIGFLSEAMQINYHFCLHARQCLRIYWSNTVCDSQSGIKWLFICYVMKKRE